MHVGIATDHGGFGLKEGLVGHLRAAGHEVADFEAHELNPDDDYPDFVIPLAALWLQGRSNAEWQSVVAAWGPRFVPTKYQESAPGW